MKHRGESEEGLNSGSVGRNNILYCVEIREFSFDRLAIFYKFRILFKKLKFSSNVEYNLFLLFYFLYTTKMGKLK